MFGEGRASANMACKMKETKESYNLLKSEVNEWHGINEFIFHYSFPLQNNMFAYNRKRVYKSNHWYIIGRTLFNVTVPLLCG